MSPALEGTCTVPQNVPSGLTASMYTAVKSGIRKLCVACVMLYIILWLWEQDTVLDSKISLEFTSIFIYFCITMPIIAYDNSSEWESIVSPIRNINRSFIQILMQFGVLFLPPEEKARVAHIRRSLPPYTETGIKGRDKWLYPMHRYQLL